MISANLQQWIQHPETLNKDTLYELRTLVTRYPYFQSLRLLYLKNLYLLHDISFGAELRKAILYVADRRKLFYLIEGERYILKPRKKNMPSEAEVLEEEPGLDRTLSLIDAFLATVPEEVSGQTTLEYSTDYTTYLLQEDEDDSCFTETLAKIYVKQHRYSKALEIIKKLSLNYPKKNAYFADQIRFLEKLIINAKSK